MLFFPSYFVTFWRRIVVSSSTCIRKPFRHAEINAMISWDFRISSLKYQWLGTFSWLLLFFLVYFLIFFISYWVIFVFLTQKEWYEVIPLGSTEYSVQYCLFSPKIRSLLESPKSFALHLINSCHVHYLDSLTLLLGSWESTCPITWAANATFDSR